MLASVTAAVVMRQCIIGRKVLQDMTCTVLGADPVFLSLISLKLVVTTYSSMDIMLMVPQVLQIHQQLFLLQCLAPAYLQMSPS